MHLRNMASRPLRADAPAAGRGRSGGGRSGGGALVFDPLEPRVLLNSDVLAVQLAAMPNDMHGQAVIVRMIEEVAQVGTQSQTVEQVQVVDKLHGDALLAFGDLSNISGISIKGGATGATVEFDADSFGGNTIPALQFKGGGGLNSLIIDHHDTSRTLTWQVNGDGTGSVAGLTPDGAAGVTFSGVQDLEANGGQNTLAGPAPNTTWNITGPNAGTLLPTGGVTTTFEGFAHLQGAADNDDTFAFSGTGAISDGVDGGAGGFDTVVDNNGFGNAVLTATDASSGTIALDDQTIAYTGMEPITLGSGGNVTIDLSAVNNAATLSDAGNGMLTLTAPGSAETETFADPTGALTIAFTNPVLGTDSLVVQSLGSFAGGLNVTTALAVDDAGQPGDHATVEFAGSVHTAGHAIDVQASDIQVDQGVTLDTATGATNAGGISLSAVGTITVAQGATLYARAASGGSTAGTDGDITLEASNSGYRQTLLPIDFTDRQVTISLTGATLDGGNVTVAAEGEDVGLTNDLPAYAKGFGTSLGQFLSEIAPTLLSLASPFDASVILRGANAAVTVDGSNIVGSGDVRVTSFTDVTTTVYTIAQSTESAIPKVPDAPFDAAIGYGQADSTVTTSVTDGSLITAGQSVLVTANGTVSDKTTARASDNVNQDSQAAFDPTTASFAAALARASLTSTVTVSADSAITAVAGNVNALALGSAKANSDASTLDYVDATAGVNFALDYSTATITSDVNGHITAGGSVAGASGTFDGGKSSVVDLLHDTITIPNNNLVTGEQVVYHAQDDTLGGPPIADTPIGGLTDGATYYVIKLNANTFQLALAPVLSLDPSVTDPVAKQTISVPNGFTFDTFAINSTTSTITLPGHGFTDGDLVTYTANGNAPITGLTDGTTYTVHVVDASDFQLLDGNGNPIAISQDNALGVQTFTDVSQSTPVVATLDLSQVDVTNNDLVIEGHGFADGQTVTYSTLATYPTDTVGALNSAQQYVVANATPDTFQLIDPSSGALVQLTGASTLTSAFAFEQPVNPPISFGGIDAASSTIYFANNTFADNDLVVYQNLGNGTIAGLTSGATYLVANATADSFQLVNAATPNGGVITVSQGTATGAQGFFDIQTPQNLSQQIVILGAAAGRVFTVPQSGLSVGDTVTFANLGGGTGTLDAAASSPVFTVATVSGSGFTLTDANGNAVTVPAGAGPFSLTPARNGQFEPFVFTPAPPPIGFATIDGTAHTLTLPSTILAVGDTVTYGAMGNTPISGLTDGRAYIVKSITGSAATGFAITLMDTVTGTIAQIAPGSGDGTQGFVDGNNTQYFTLGSVDLASGTFDVMTNGLAAGQSVLYTSLVPGGGAAIGGLTSGTTYFVANATATGFTLVNSSGNAVTLTVPAGESAPLAFTLTPIVVNPVDDSIFLPNHGLVTGQEVVYNVDPAITTTRTALVQDPTQANPASTLTVTSTDQEIGGLQNDEAYFVVVVDANHIRVTTDETSALEAVPIDLTSLGAGNADQVSATDRTTGIGVSATLSSDVRGKAKGEVGGKINPVKYTGLLSLKPDLLISAILGNSSPTSTLVTGKNPIPVDSNGNQLAPNNQNDSLSAAGAIVVNYTDNVVSATVGADSAAGMPTVLTTPSNLAVKATISQTDQAIAIANVSKPKTSGGVAVALGLSVQILQNTTQALIAGNAVTDAGLATTLTSTVTYPFLVVPAQLDPLLQIVTSGLSGITNLIDGTFGADTYLNNWVADQAKAAGNAAVKSQTAPSITGSIAVNVFTNSAHAEVQSGAMINQTTALQTASQSVALTATTTIDQLDLAGIGKFSLNEGPAGKAKYEILAPLQAANKAKPGSKAIPGFGNVLGQLASGGEILDTSGRSGSAALGGSLLINSIADDTQAIVDPGAFIHVGSNASAKLALLATELLTTVAIAQAGGLTQGSSSVAFAGSGLGNAQRSTTYAGLESDDTPGMAGGVNVSGSAPVTVKATTGGTQVQVAGAIVVGDGGSGNIGVSTIINYLDRGTAAFIGGNPTDPQTTPTGTSSITAGNLTLDAETTGYVVPIDFAGVVATNDSSAPSDVNAAKPSTGTTAQQAATNGNSVTQTTGSGGVAGAVATAQQAIGTAAPATKPATSSTGSEGLAGAGVATVELDTTLAYINATGTIAASAVSVTANNTQNVVDVAGAVSVQFDAGKSGSKTLSGGFAFNYMTPDTEAFIRAVTLNSSAPLVSGQNQVAVAATHGGEIYSFAVAASADTNVDSTAFAGSLAINIIFATTLATIDSAAVTTKGNVATTATDSAAILAVGGAASLTDGTKGIGASIGYNQISASTIAGVLGTDRQAVLTLGGGLTISAVNANAITAIGVSLGAAGEGTGVAFTVGINIIAPNRAVFGHDDANAITATISNADVTTGGAVSLTAQDNSDIFSIAGALAIGGSGSAYGFALSWNQIVLQVNATIVDSVVDAGGAVMLLAESTSTNAPEMGKIVAAAAAGAIAVNTSSNAFGGALSIDGVIDTITAGITNGSAVTSPDSITVDASDTSAIDTYVGGLAVGGDTAVGAALGGDFIDNVITAEIGTGSGTTATSVISTGGGDIDVDATEAAQITAVTAGLSGGYGIDVGGSVSANVVTDSVTAEIADTAVVTTAGRVSVVATNDATIIAIGGGIAIGGDVAVGASLVAAIIVNTNTALISGDAVVTGTAGVTVMANATQRVTVVAVGGALSLETAAVAGAVTVTVISDTTQAEISAAGVTPGAVTAGTGAGTTGGVVIAAVSGLVLIGTAGVLAASPNVGVGAGADAGVVTRRTYAFIGAGAKVSADGSVEVTATATEQVISNSIAGAGGGEVGVGVTAGVSTLTLATQAYIDAGAIVFARNNVLVAAQDDTTGNQFAGAVSGAGSDAVGVSIGIGVLSKSTSATINAGASVTGLALGGAISAPTGGFASGSTSDAQKAPVHVAFAASAVDASSSEIAADSTGLQTGDEVLYNAPGLPVGGLESGLAYYVIVIDSGHIQLAASRAAALAGQYLALSAGGAAATDIETLDRLNPEGLPTVSSPAFDNNAIDNVTAGSEATAFRSGVIVVAVGTTVLENAGAAVAGAGMAALTAAGAVAVHTIDTIAAIAAGAQINAANGDAGAGASQSVFVDAGRLYRDDSVGIGVAGAGAAAAAPALVLPILHGTTSATIQGTLDGSGTQTAVDARGDVEVAATANARFVAIGIGLAGAGEVAVGGSFAVVTQDTTTIADIYGNTRVTAGGNVAVLASDDTTVYAIAGAGAISGGGAGAGAFAVTQLQKVTDALIESGAIVDAAGTGDALLTVPTGTSGSGYGTTEIHGVAVQAESTENVTDGAGCGAGGVYLGLAGAVTIEILDGSTLAAIRSGARVSQNTGAQAGALQDVSVTARDTIDEVAVAGAIGGGGLAGVGAGVDVAVVRDDTQAVIDHAAVSAVGSVSVAALDQRDVNSTTVAVGAGLFGLGGGISVVSIGGFFSSNYGATTDTGTSESSDALSGGNGSVIGQVNSGINTLVGSLLTPDSGGLPPIDPATAVDPAAHTVNFGQADNLNTGDAVTYSAGGGTAIGGLTDGQTYYVIAVDADHIELAASHADALAGSAIAITNAGATGTAHSFTPAYGAAQADQARTNAGPSLPSNAVTQATGATTVASGTTAVIENASVVSANSISVIADQEFTVTVAAGGGGFGAVAVGLGIAVVTMQADVSAYIGPDVSVVGLGGSGSLTVEAVRNGVFQVLGVAGAASGFVSLGGAVAVVTDSSATSALFGAYYSSGVQQGTIGNGATVGGSGFAHVAVTAQSTPTIDMATGAAAISEGAGLGAAITSATISGDTNAAIGAYAAVGSATVPVGSITVSASRTATVAPFNPGQPIAIALGGGLLAGAASVTTIAVAGNVSATTGDFASLQASGAVAITATDNKEINVFVDGGTLGLIAIGTVVGRLLTEGEIDAGIGSRSGVQGGSVSVGANARGTRSLAVYPSGGGIIAGDGSNATLVQQQTVAATVGQLSVVTATAGAIAVTGTTAVTTALTTGGTDLGGVVVGASVASATVNDTTGAEISVDTTLAATGDVSVQAYNGDNEHTTSTLNGGGFVGVLVGSLSDQVTALTTANIDDGVVIAAGGSLSVEARESLTALIDPSISAGAFGGGTNLTANQTVTNTTTVTIGTGAALTAANAEISAEVIQVNAQDKPTATTTAAFGGSDTSSTQTVSTTVLTTISPTVRITAPGSVDIAALQDSLTASTDAFADARAIGGGVADGPVTLDAVTMVEGAATAVVETHTFSARSSAPGSASAGSNLVNSGLGIAGNPHSDAQNLTNTRSIDWNATLIIDALPNAAVLTVDAAGNIVTQQNISATVSGGTIDVADLAASAITHGTANFAVSAATGDNSGAGAAVSATITGAPIILIRAGLSSVTITNESALALHLGGIDLTPGPVDASTAVTVTPTPHPLFTPVTQVSNAGAIIDVGSTASPTNVFVGGDIENPGGTTTIDAGAAIIEASARGQSISSGTLDLFAGTAVGSATAPIAVGSAVLNAVAGNGDVRILASGTLGVGAISSVLGNTAIDAGTIAGVTGASGILARFTTLTGTSGGIGSVVAPVTVATPGGPGLFTATAAGTIVIAGGLSGLAPTSVLASVGDVVLLVPDDQSTGQDITVGAGETVRSVAGNVTLNAGDNVVVAAGGVVQAATAVDIIGDQGQADPGLGTVIQVPGRIIAPQVTIAASADPGTISLDNTMLGSTTTIETGGGQTVVRLGSLASATANTGGVLTPFAGSVIVQGSGGLDELDIDDTGNAAGGTGRYAGGALTGFGLGGSIVV
jgi:hypothetical protein